MKLDDSAEAATPSQPQRVVAVLGMHRSGTSALARGLECIGVNLGNDLLAGQEENPVGFFEDRWAIDISDRVLAELHMRWDSPSVPDDARWGTDALESLRLEATVRLRERCAGHPVWGFKNPRTARLLPFWQSVFKHIGARDAYVLALRNPLSVARSIERRNGFSHAKSHLLWLLHVTEAVVHTRGRLRVCVDYDELLDDPDRVLAHVASTLDLDPVALDKDALREYREHFLATEMRHSLFEPADVAVDQHVAELAARAYSVLRRWAAREIDGRSAVLTREFNQIRNRILELAPVLSYLNDVEEQHAVLSKFDEAATQRIHSLEKETSDRGAELASLRSEQQTAAGELEEARRARETALEESERIRGVLDQAQQQLTSTAELLRDRDGELTAREAALKALRRELSLREKELIQQSEHRAGLEQTLAEREARLEHMSSEIEGQAGLLALADQKLAEGEAQLERTGREIEEQAAGLASTEQNLSAEQEHRVGLEQMLAEREAQLERTSREIEEQAVSLASVEYNLRAERKAVEKGRVERERAVRVWLFDRVAKRASELAALADAMSRTRTWRHAIRIQRALDRLRRRGHRDFLFEARKLAGDLESRALAADCGLPILRTTATSLAEAIECLHSNTPLRLLRWLARLSRGIALRSYRHGPYELLGTGSAEVAYFLRQWDDYPIDLGEPPSSQDPDANSTIDDPLEE